MNRLLPIIMGLVLVNASAYATLGEPLQAPASSLSSRPLNILLAPTPTPEGNYAVYQYQDTAGRTIKEYLSPQNIVFAVFWQGQTLPNLRQLLGHYFPGYVQSQQLARSGLHSLHSQTPGLVVSSLGRMGSGFAGMAYDPALVPTGVHIDELK